MRKICFITALLTAGIIASAEDHFIHSFKKIQLSDQFWAEGASFGDFNHDGKGDVVAGPYWWEGPDFKKRHEYYPATQTFKKKAQDGSEETIPGFEGALGVNNAYSDNFFAFTQDFNKDGWDDILIYGFPGKDASWYENPKGKEGHWMRHKVFDVVDNESPAWADITGDGKNEIICSSAGYYGYAEPNWSDPSQPWKFTRISPKGNWQRFTHGLGYGDVNGDGKMDLLEKDGWWEQPPSSIGGIIRALLKGMKLAELQIGHFSIKRGTNLWTQHKTPFGMGGAQMYVYDVNGDGLNDVITSIAAHGYGLAWYEQTREKGTGEIKFKEHVFMNKAPKENKYGVVFSQPHAIDLVDMDGDGLKDIVTGKRFWAHGAKGDADPNAPAVLYWFKLVRNADKSVDFVPYKIDDDSGIGTQVAAGDINGDKLPDIVVGNKKGVFVFLHSKKKVSQQEWEKAQPKLAAN